MTEYGNQNENSWSDQILRAVHDLGGSASVPAIYEWIEDNVPLTAMQRDEQYDGRPQYQHIVRSYLSNLVESGDLVRVRRGTYRLPTRSP